MTLTKVKVIRRVNRPFETLQLL